MPKNDRDSFDPDDELLYVFTLVIGSVGCDELDADVVSGDGLFMSTYIFQLDSYDNHQDNLNSRLVQSFDQLLLMVLLLMV